jgi:DNA uptake protein ComE-like DNA-binding protein
VGCHGGNKQSAGGGGGQAEQKQAQQPINQGASGRKAGANTAGGASGSVTAYGNQRSYDNSNPVTREESGKHAAVLRTQPKQGAMQANTEGRIQNPKSEKVSQGGKPVKKVDVNHATSDELAKVPGVSKNLAIEIVAHRPYANQADLVKKVPNLNETYARAIVPYLSFSGGGAGTGGKATTPTHKAGTTKK